MVKTTKLGKRSRKPSGIDMDEFPFNLMRLLKKDNRDSVLGFSSFHSAALGVQEIEGRRLYSRCAKSMVKDFPAGRRRLVARLWNFYLDNMQPSSNMD